MLRIGDIHITSKRKDAILDELKLFISRFPDEQEIVFFGDYVYHFNYDRKALLALFSFFVSLYKEGKSVYILAGNHDWISNHFVYEEAKQAFDIVDGMGGEKACLRFITKPEIVSLQGQDCLFFPFHQIEQQSFTVDYFKDLLTSPHAKERLSGRANSLLYDLIDEWKKKNDIKKSKELFVFHHRYIAKTQFPGQWSRFSYKSPALDPLFAEQKNIRLVSGHLHQSFNWKNYLCLGSVWSTSPLEVNQQKYLFQYDGVRDIVYPYVAMVNPYIQGEIDAQQKVTQSLLEGWYAQYQEKSKKSLTIGKWNIVFEKDLPPLDLPYTTLSLISSELGYANLIERVDEKVFQKLQSVKIKKKTQSGGLISKQLLDAGSNLDKSINDRKELLLQYINMKYGKNVGQYIKVLENLDII